MLFRLATMLLALVFVGFTACSPVWAAAKGKSPAKKVELCRFVDEGKGGKVLLQQYAENLTVHDPTINKSITYN